MKKALMLTTVLGNKEPNLDALTLEQAMLYLCDVAYWPMTEASGKSIDKKRGFEITWVGDVTMHDYQLPNGDFIPSFGGVTSEGTLYTTAFRDAFPYDKGSLVCVCRVPSTAIWETADGIAHNLFKFGGAPHTLYAARSGGSSMQAYRDSNAPFDSSGLIHPCLVGVTWDTATGNMILYINGRRGSIVANQVAMSPFADGTSVRIGSSTTYGDNNWVGQIGHFGLSNRVLIAPQFRAIYQKIITTTERRLFVIGDSKSTGANFWPGYLCNLLNTATGDYWTDGPRRFALGGYDIAAMKNYIDANLSTETEMPEFILINMGTNDARAVTITAEAAFKTNYTAVIDAIRAKWPDVPIFLQHVYRADSSQTITNSGVINGYIDDIVASYATGVYAGPADDVYIENGDAGATYLQTDKIHYAVAAHSQVAQQWFTILQAAGLVV